MKLIGVGLLIWDSILLIFIPQKEPNEAAEGSPCTLFIINFIKYHRPICHHALWETRALPRQNKGSSEAKQGLFRSKSWEHDSKLS